jgi:hypothetical protein
MITMPVRARLASGRVSAQKPAALMPVLAAMARAFRALRKLHFHSLPTEAVRRPTVPIIVVYDVLDVIGAGRGVTGAYRVR